MTIKFFALAIAAVAWQTVSSLSPLDAQVYIYDGGSIYHQKDCVAMTGRIQIRPVTLRALGKGWDPDPYCKAPHRQASAPFGPIAAEYVDLFVPPTVSAGLTLPPATAQVDGGPSIRAKCAAEWPDDFRMRAYCERQQQDAQTRLAARAMPSGDLLTIRTKCRKDWPADYRMQNYCEEQQLKALAIVK